MSEVQHKSRRYTDAVFGCVNFPIGQPNLEGGGGGGTFVKLVVVDDRELGVSDWDICCGASVYDMRTASFVGDDRAVFPTFPVPETQAPEVILAQMDESTRAENAWDERHFPALHDKDEPSIVSRPYLASMVLGLTGRTFFDQDSGNYWACRFEDLTEQGKALYRQLEQLYPGCQLHLLTFLDT